MDETNQTEDQPKEEETSEQSEQKEASSQRTRRRASASSDDASAKSQPRQRRGSTASTGDKAAQEEEKPEVPEPRPLPRLLARVRNEIGPTMVQEFSYTSPMQIPRLSKVVLNIGLGEALLNPRAMEAATRDLTLISGQKPLTTRAKKSIAGFKIREDMPIGLSVTLRGRRMYEFVDRLISSVLPRIRDFQGVSRTSFDGRGNYSLGIREQVIFPEIDYNSIDRIRGLQVNIVTTAPTDAEGLRFLELMGMPFARTRDAARVA